MICWHGDGYVRRIADLWQCGRTGGWVGEQIARLQERAGVTEEQVREGYLLAMRELAAKAADRRDRGMCWEG